MVLPVSDFVIQLCIVPAHNNTEYTFFPSVSPQPISPPPRAKGKRFGPGEEKKPVLRIWSWITTAIGIAFRLGAN